MEGPILTPLNAGILKSPEHEKQSIISSIAKTKPTKKSPLLVLGFGVNKYLYDCEEYQNRAMQTLKIWSNVIHYCWYFMSTAHIK